VKESSLLRRYGWAVLATLAALAARLALKPVLGMSAPHFAFILAVLYTAIRAGLGPGFLSVALGGVAVEWFFILPLHGFAIVPLRQQPGLVAYFVSTSIIVLLSDAQRKAKLRAQAAAGLAESRRVELERALGAEIAAAAEKRQREWLEVTLSSIGDGVIATDTAGRVTLINPAAASLTGWPPAEARGCDVETVFSIRNADTGAPVENPALRAMREGRVVGLANHTVLISRGGKRLPIDDSGAPIVDAAGEVCGAVLVFRDVSEKKAREAELRQRERMINLSHDAVIVADAGRRIQSWNRGASELYGWNEAEARGKVMHDLLGTLSSLRMDEVDEILRQHGEWEGELAQTTKGERKIDVESRQLLIRDDRGEIIGILEINRDITDRMRAEDALRQSEWRFRRLVESSTFGIILGDTRGAISYANPAWLSMLGYSAEELAAGAVRWDKLTPPEFASLDAAAADEIRSAGVCALYEKVFVAKDGRWVPVLIGACALERNGGEPLVAAFVTDLTASKRMEAEIERRAREAEEGRRILEALMEHIPEGITIAAAPDARVVMVSKHGQRLTGRPVEALGTGAGQHAESWALYRADGVTQPDPDELPLVRAVRSGVVTEDEEWVIQDAAGQKHWILVNAGPMRGRNGNITGGIAAWRDITDRRQFEERLRHAQRLESIGVLAGGIAHDFNNLLTGIMGGASLLREELPRWDPNYVLVESILKSSERAADLTRQLLAYSGKGRFFIENLDLSETVREIAKLAGSSIPRTVRLELALASDLPAVEADRGQIHQIVMNLVTNAAEAIGERTGTVSIRTGVQEVDEHYISQHDPVLGADHAAPGLFVFVEVEDTGCGMERETIAKIFDPFFTTKFTGRGLGLAAAQGIVRGHRGLMRVYSQPGQGSCFRVLLPVAGAVSRKPEIVQSLQHLVGSGIVLVVDDEETVRLTAKTALERCGYTVLLAGDGEQAVEAFRGVADQVTCVVLDMTMPVMSGEETLERLRQIRADVPVVLSSGYNQVEAIRRFTGKGLAGFIGKPYTSTQLAAQVKAASTGA
jgi:two-component system cell cycle sensor histidine kinase/response regulator CckA